MSIVLKQVHMVIAGKRAEAGSVRSSRRAFLQGFYHAGGDHLLEPLGLGMVVEIDAAHQVVSCRTACKQSAFKSHFCTFDSEHLFVFLKLLSYIVKKQKLFLRYFDDDEFVTTVEIPLLSSGPGLQDKQV